MSEGLSITDSDIKYYFVAIMVFIAFSAIMLATYMDTKTNRIINELKQPCTTESVK